MSVTVAEQVDALLQAAYPEFVTTKEVVDFLDEDYVRVYRALCRLEANDLAVKFKLPGIAQCAWAMRSAVGT